MLLGGETYALLQKRSAQSAQHGTGRRLSNAEGPVQNLADCSCPRGGGDRRYGGLGDGSATERVRLCVTRGDRQEVRPRVRPVVPAVQKKRLSSRFFLTPPREIPGGGSPTRRGHKRVVVWKRR